MRVDGGVDLRNLLRVEGPGHGGRVFHGLFCVSHPCEGSIHNAALGGPVDGGLGHGDIPLLGNGVQGGQELHNLGEFRLHKEVVKA